VGLSKLSSSISILVAQVPGTPQVPITQLIGTDTKISWNAPDDGSTPITSYKILIAQSDGVTFTESAYCKGNRQDIMTNTTCNVPNQELHGLPFLLPWSGNVNVIISAQNLKGSSPNSTASDTSIILWGPSVP
jgi:hypothetical protein